MKTIKIITNNQINGIEEDNIIKATTDSSIAENKVGVHRG